MYHELTKYFDKTEKLFSDILIEHGMTLSMFGTNSIFLSGPKCVIEFSTGHYYLDFACAFENPITKKKYSFWQILEKKGLVDKVVFPREQQREIEKIKDEIWREIYGRYIFIKTYCADLLNGDFSILEI